jgi:L-ascorbate metabolism protein UlaG (beta-lactamase superfamily)
MFRLLGSLFAGLFLVVATTLGQGGAAAPHIQITWHGQSFFELRSSKGTNVIIDPHVIPEYGRLLVPPKADLVLMSHDHTDHNAIEVFDPKDLRGGKMKVLQGWKKEGGRVTWNLVQETVKDVKVRSVGLYHDDVRGTKNGINTGFVIEMDGWHIVHLGDIGHLLTPEQLRQIGPVDVVMIPVGGVYTLNGTEAKKVVEQLKPKEYIFPMHYGTDRFDDLLPVTEFLEDQPAKLVAREKDNKLFLNRDEKRPRPLIVTLNYWPKARADEEKGK